MELAATGWSVHAHATAARTTLSFAGWQSDAARAYGPVTWFAPVDTSDAAGKLSAGLPFSAEGLVNDRWAMDFDGATGLFRAVLAAGWNQGATLRTWTSPTPAEATPLSSLSGADRRVAHRGPLRRPAGLPGHRQGDGPALGGRRQRPGRAEA